MIGVPTFHTLLKMNKMKSTLTDLITTQARIEAKKPKRHARGEGILALRQFVKTTARLYDFMISDKMADEIAAEWLVSGEFEPMLGDVGLQANGGIV